MSTRAAVLRMRFAPSIQGAIDQDFGRRQDSLDMSNWIALFLDVFALIAIIPVVAFGFYYGSLVFYFGIRIARRRRKDAPLTWHDGWGVMRFGQIVYPELLDDEGRLLRSKMIFALKRSLIAAAGAIVVTVAHEAAKIIAPL